jgi:ATP-binding cassette subfamily F protein 3
MRRAAADRRAELSPLRQRITTAERDIARFTATLAELDAALSDPHAFARDPERAGRLAKARADTAAAIVKAEEDWLDASSAYERAAIGV